MPADLRVVYGAQSSGIVVVVVVVAHGAAAGAQPVPHHAAHVVTGGQPVPYHAAHAHVVAGREAKVSHRPHVDSLQGLQFGGGGGGAKAPSSH